MANEKRLIDANALCENIKKRYCEQCHAQGKDYKEVVCRACDIDDMRIDIEDAPTVDAVEVVRCGQCKHWEQYYRLTDRKEPALCGECRLISMDISMNANDFCSYGERRTDHENP